MKQSTNPLDDNYKKKPTFQGSKSPLNVYSGPESSVKANLNYNLSSDADYQV